MRRKKWMVLAICLALPTMSVLGANDDLPPEYAFMSRKDKISYDTGVVQNARVDETHARSDYNGALNVKRQAFNKSSELLAAEKAVAETVKEQAAAKAKVLDKLKGNSQYASFVKQEEDANAKVDALKKKGVRGDEMSTASTSALRAGNRVSDMERKALADDDAYKAASDKLVETSNAVNDLKTKFETSLQTDKDVLKLKKALEDASTKLEKAQNRLTADTGSRQ